MTPADRLFASFDRLYILNLSDRTDRRREMAGELARIGTSFADPRVRLFGATRPDTAGHFPSVGARGCFVSHLAILREAHALGCHAILILEDDCDFVAGFESLLRPALDMLDILGFDIFYGGYELPDGPGGADAGATPLVLADWATPVRVSHFIGFGRAAMDGLIPYLETMLEAPPGGSGHGGTHIDIAYSRFRAGRPDLIAWLASPQLGYQRPSRPDVAPPTPIDRLPGLPRIVARRMKRFWKRRFPA